MEMIEYPSDNHVIESMARIRHDPDYKRIMTWLDSERLKLATRSMIMETKEVGRMQGGYLTLEEFLNIVNGAASVIDAAHERKQKPKTRIP